MSHYSIDRHTCDACQKIKDATNDPHKSFGGLPSGWTRVAPTAYGPNNPLSATYFDLCEECSTAWQTMMDGWLANWGKGA